jgi:hypothetical protein
MAIKIEFNSKFGGTYTEAYARINSIIIDYTAQHAQVSVGIYKDESARNKKMQPLEVEIHNYSGEEFTELFAEILADKEGPGISPIRNVYEDLSTKEGDRYDKYKEAGKVFDTDFDTGKEISREETLRKAKEAVEAAHQAVIDAEDNLDNAYKDKKTTKEQIATLEDAVDNANDVAKETEAAYRRLLDAEETDEDKGKLK